MCTCVERKEKLLAPKLDSLLKHENCYKCKVSMPNVDTSFYYYNKKLIHAKNEHAYVAHDQPFVLEKMLADVPIEYNHKYMQFVVLFHLVVHGCPMTNYENLKLLLQLLKVKNLSINHWFDTSSCSMVMHSMLLKTIKVHLLLLPFIVINVYKVITIDNTQWISIHLYVVQTWKNAPNILCVETIGISNTSNNHFSLMLKCLFEFGGLGLGELVGKLVNMGCDGNNVFQGHQTSVT